MSKTPIRHLKAREQPRFLRDGKVALGVTIGACGGIVSYLLLDIFEFGLNRQEYLELAPAMIALIVAATSTILSFIALREQRRMREASTDPVLIAHFGQREDARTLVTFNLTNVGAGAATNIRLNVTPPEVDLGKRDLITNVFVRHHPFRVIPQGHSISFSLAPGWSLLGENPLPPFKVSVEYEDIEGTEYWMEVTLDIREMEKLGAEASMLARSAKALEKVAHVLEKAGSGSTPLNVRTQTKAEYQHEQSEWLESVKKKRDRN